jgi:hypothetical protein
MDEKLCNSIEAIASLHYLIRMSQKDPAAIARYVDRADAELESMLLHLGRGQSCLIPYSQRLRNAIFD